MSASKSIANELCAMFRECIDALDLRDNMPEAEATELVVKALCAVLCDVSMNGLAPHDRLPEAADLKLAHRLMVALGYAHRRAN